MLSVLILLENLKWMIPTTFMIGAAPAYISVWGAWRLLSSVLPKWVYVKGDDFLFSTYHRNVLFYFETLTGTEMIFYGDLDAMKELSSSENVIYLSNHQSTVDWVIASSVSLRRGCLGQTRYILKDGLRFLPLYGFYLGMHGSVFVKRGGKFQREKAEKQLAAAAEIKTPMWMVIFPEGTRYNPENTDVIEASQKISGDNGVPALHHVLYPRLGATQVCVNGLRSELDCVYDVTIAYSSSIQSDGKRGRAPSMQDFLMGMSRKIHVHVKRIPFRDIPTESNNLKQWMYARHQEKDKMLTQFYSASSAEEAKFPGKSLTHNLPLSYLLPSVALWSGTFAVMVSCDECRGMYWKVGLGAAVTGLLWMAVRH